MCPSRVDLVASINSRQYVLSNFEGNKNRYRIRFIFLSGCVPLSRPNLITRRIGRASKEKLHVLSCSRAASSPSFSYPFDGFKLRYSYRHLPVIFFARFISR